MPRSPSTFLQKPRCVKRMTEKPKAAAPSPKKKPVKGKNPVANPYEHTTIYKKNEKTGEWEVKNPSGSIAYNYLYRHDYEEEEAANEYLIDEMEINR